MKLNKLKNNIKIKYNVAATCYHLYLKKYVNEKTIIENVGIQVKDWFQVKNN